MTGNTTLSNDTVAWLVQKFSFDGDALWSRQWTCSSCSDAYGVNLTLSGIYLYVTGVVKTSATALDFDILVQKYNVNSGNLQWTKTFDAGSPTEFPIEIKVRNNVVYVAGTTLDSSNGFDMFIAKLSTAGVFGWAKTYDYSGFDETAAELRINNNDEAIVFGGSSISASSWEVTLLTYDTTGVLVDSVRSLPTGLDRNLPLAFLQADNKLYIGGSYIDTANVQNARLIQYQVGSTTINHQWTKNINIQNRKGSLLGIRINDSGAVFATGGATDSQGHNLTWLERLEGNGNTVWQRLKGAAPAEDMISGKYFALNPDGAPLVAMQHHDPQSETIYLVQYDTLGKLQWQRPLVAGNTAVATNLLIPNGTDIFVTGIIENPTGDQVYYLTGLEQYLKTNTRVLDNNDKPLYIAEDVIIRFSPNVLDTNFIDNPKLSYSSVDKVITDTSLIAEMDTRLGANGGFGDWKLFKIYHTFNTSTTTITGRQGIDIAAPPLWATLVLEIGPSSLVKVPPEVCDSLASIKREWIRFAEPNYLGTLPSPPPTPDPLFLQQLSFFNSSNGVNMEEAWDIMDGAGWNNSLYADGLDMVLTDSGVRFQHEDLRCEGCPGIQLMGQGQKSIVVEALDFTDITFPNDLSGIEADFQDLAENENAEGVEQGHGTLSAGILSAIRDNGKGISGITSNSEHNVKLHSYRVFEDLLTSNSSAVSFLMNGLGFVLNCNGTSIEYDCDNRDQLDLLCIEAQFLPGGVPNIGLVDSEALREIMELLYDAQYIQTTARGNYGFQEEDTPVYPSSYEDRWTVSVGASGLDGVIVTTDNNGENTYESSYGADMDIIAPGISDYVHSTSKVSSSSYNDFSGTSAALPHVTGTVAMLMLHHPTPRAQEDVEHLLEYTATDVASTSYDDENGWGRLNAGNALEFIDPNGDNFRVVQAVIDGDIAFDDDPFGCDNACDIGLFRGERDLDGSSVNSYIGRIRKYSHSFSIDISQYGLSAPPATINGDTDKLPFWVRSSATNLWFKPDYIQNPGFYSFLPDNHLAFEGTPQFNANVLSGTIVGYAIILEDDVSKNGSIPLICMDSKELATPQNPININECYYDTPRLTFSFLAQNPSTEVDPILITSTEDQHLAKATNRMHLFPNPTTHSCRVQLDTPAGGSGTLLLYNGRGQVLATQNVQLSSQAATEAIFDLSTYPPGMYAIQLSTDQSSITSKIIKQ